MTARIALLQAVNVGGTGKLAMIEIGKREVYVFYPDGIGESKLKIPALMRSGTALHRPEPLSKSARQRQGTIAVLDAAGRTIPVISHF